MPAPVLPQFRNHGYSWGLEYLYIFGDLPEHGWSVWHRTTGQIVFVSDSRFEFEAKTQAEKESLRLNGNPKLMPWLNDLAE